MGKRVQLCEKILKTKTTVRVSTKEQANNKKSISKQFSKLKTKLKKQNMPKSHLLSETLEYINMQARVTSQLICTTLFLSTGEQKNPPKTVLMIPLCKLSFATKQALTVFVCSLYAIYTTRTIEANMQPNVLQHTGIKTTMNR